MSEVRIFSVSLLFLTLSCASPGKPPIEDAENVSASVGQGGPEMYLEQTAAITGQEFIDQPPGNLEALFGAPNFVRREGVGEFRRYDTPSCRIYAVVMPDPDGRQLVKSLNVGSLKASDPVPVFGECLNFGS